MIQPIPAERIPERTVEEITHQERISERAQIVDAPVPQILAEPDAPVPQLQEETVEVFQLFSQERTSECIVEQIVVFSEIPKLQTVHGTQTPEKLENPLVRQAAEMVEVESTMSAESQASQVAVDCVQPAPEVEPRKRKRKKKVVKNTRQQQKILDVI